MYKSIQNDYGSGPGLDELQGVTHTPSSLPSDAQYLMLEELRELKELTRRVAEDPPLKSQAIWTFLLQFFGLLAGTIFGVFAILAWKEGKQANSMAANGNALASRANDLAQSAYTMAVSANNIASNGNSMGLSALSLAMTANSLASTGVAYASLGNFYAATGLLKAQEANNIALIAYCNPVPSGNEDACSSIQSYAAASIEYYASSFFVITSSSSMSSPSTILSSTETSAIITTTQLIPSTYFTYTTPTSESTTSPNSTPIPTTAPTVGESSSGPDKDIIVGATVGAVGGIALFLAAAYLPYRTWKARVQRSQEMANPLSHGGKRYQG